MENKKLITVEASMENLDKITSFVEAFLDDYACPMKIAMKILLCVEELYANVVNYAYGSRGGNCTIELEGKAYETEQLATDLENVAPHANNHVVTVNVKSDVIAIDVGLDRCW